MNKYHKDNNSVRLVRIGIAYRIKFIRLIGWSLLHKVQSMKSSVTGFIRFVIQYVGANISG